MTKLLYITNQISNSGGLERVLSIKASFLAEKMGYEVHILTLNDRTENLFYDFSPKIIHHNLSISSNKIKYLFDYIKGIREKVKLINPDIISVCDDGQKGFLIPKIIKKPCPMVYERHVSRVIVGSNTKSNLINKLQILTKNAIMDYGANAYDAFVVLTKSNVSEWKNQNVKVISNPLSFYPEESALLKNKKVIAVGKHCYQKGYDRLLKIWQIVIKKHPDWCLEIYGAPNKDHNLKELANKLNIEKNVTFYKPEKNIKEKFMEASIHVLSSRYEGFGMVLIEAMSCGVPPISFDCPCGPSDIITENKDGILIKNGDVQEFSAALFKLIENENLRLEMGKQAKTNVKRYLPENIVKQWDELFVSLIK
ncbi:glycosyltransferase family 4 protein [Tamlana sp. I1]|uniref:glycosyltransferase family 4 protein n=1 Tax=Tamlana sp. I1 TaxID=2762061 RepID=UPI00188EC182|nr:glycosyltransferase family 4 protein [Tamlana sp. I1]